MDLVAVRRLGASIIALALVASAGAQTPPKELSGLSMDDLMNVEVTSLARHGERLSDSAAAVFVISRDDIARSGATTIPEILRIVPGLEVASVNGTEWAISARGFNGRWSNKLLVMIDGRTVYTPMFSGVFWHLQDTLLEDIDRIEVIRGPGGTLWGANAVDGIINIITRNSIETQGTMVSAGGGIGERAFGAARYGGAAGDDVHFRVFAKSFSRSPNHLASVAHADDESSGERVGLHADWLASGHNNVTLEAEAYREISDETTRLVPPTDPFHGPTSGIVDDRGADVLLRWTETQSKRSETTLQTYFDYVDHPSPQIRERFHVFDVDFQHELSLGTRHSLVWGLGYRRSSAETASPLELVSLATPRIHDGLSSGFVQDEVHLPHDIRLTLGSKVQHDDFSGYQLQPTIRALWRPSERQAVWAAATDSVRTPSWIELGGTINLSGFAGPDGQPGLVEFRGNKDLKPERALTYETGYRWMAGSEASIDVSTFYSRFKGIVGNQRLAPYRDETGRLIVPLQFANEASGHSEGLEIFATDRLTNRVDLRAGYTWMNIHGDEVVAGPKGVGLTDTPSNQVQLRAFFTISPALELDTSAYYVSTLRATDVPAYVRLDLRLAWQASPSWEFSLVGQNLFDDKHQEFVGIEGPAAGPINRSIYGKITWHSH